MDHFTVRRFNVK